MFKKKPKRWGGLLRVRAYKKGSGKIVYQIQKPTQGTCDTFWFWANGTQEFFDNLWEAEVAASNLYKELFVEAWTVTE